MKPLFAALLLASPVMAQEAVPCDWVARADSIVEPWEDHTASFANGEVRLALLDTVEPAAAAFHILIVSPPYDEIGTRQCRTLGATATGGFSGVDFASLEAHYDETVGLVFYLNVSEFDGVEFVPGVLVFTLNQATGAINAQVQ